MEKITQEVLNNNIKDVWYTFPPGGRMTLCVLTTDSGFQLVGESACLNTEEFDQSRGMNYARLDAEKKLWTLMTYNVMEDNRS